MSHLKNLEDLVSYAIAVDSDGKQRTQEEIRKIITLGRSLHSVTDAEAEHLARKFESIHSISMNAGNILQEPFKPWLEDAKSEIVPYFWDRYKKFLVKKEFSGQVIAALDEVTDRALGLLENPRKEGQWDRRGMVVGHVQSGKTANYIGLINKAADAGYGVIIVIAGIHNNLRDQTQTRIEEGFVGFQKQHSATPSRPIGVGHFDQTRIPTTMTSSVRDFNTAIAGGVRINIETHSEPIVFVIKKNSKTLANLIRWLTYKPTITSPMLLIDDEADNASINIKKGADEVSRINGLIRELLNVFSRSGYIGYTATPFANIFIDPADGDEMYGQDLFPRDFIISLDAPSNYFGATRVFIDDADKVTRYIEDNEDLLPQSHDIDHDVLSLPGSLETSIRTFVIARAIRLARNQINQHNSMLVNVSRFVGIQKKMHYLIHELVEQIKDNVRVNGAKQESEALKNQEISALHTVFKYEYAETCGFSWSEVQKFLWDSVSPIKVVEVNSHSSGHLNYADCETGLNVIAVGGFSLSRGLTLEGLVISYFLRNSMMYDTLMQMGRWFGYRPKYEDLCRVWMPEEAVGWYAYIADAVEELREEFRRMEAANATPKEFGLKVRSHPGTLIVTARNKMGSGQHHVVLVGLANKFIETIVLDRDSSALEQNRKAATALARSLRDAGKDPARESQISCGRLVRNVPVSVVMEFIGSFRNHKMSPHTRPEPVLDYIRARSSGELKSWDILLVGVKNKSLVDTTFGFDLFCQRRSLGKRSTKTELWIGNKQRVSSRGIEEQGLTPVQIQKARADYRKRESLPDDSSPNYPDRIYREARATPLLIVHMLAIVDKETQGLVEGQPVVAWSISFPQTEQEEKKVEYIANTTWFQEHFPEEDEDEAGGEDD